MSQEHKFAEAPPTRFERRPLDWKILADGEPPARDWAIDGWLGMGHATLLAALGGMGKSLVGQQIGSALALGGHDFIDKIPRPRRVLGWFSEDDHDELWRRQVQIAAHFGVQLDAFAGKFVVESFADRDCTLMDLDLGGRLCVTAMLEELHEQVADYRAEVVILDHAARMFGGNESDRNQVTRFLAELNGAAAGAAILLLAHPGRANGSEYSGSSAWENAARARLFLSDRKPGSDMFNVAGEDEPASDRRYLAKRKTNYSSRELRVFRYENGVLVPDGAPGANGGLIGAISDRNDEALILRVFPKLTGDLGQQPTDGATSPHFLPRLILQFKLADGRTERDLASAMRRLMLDGKLRKAQVGRYSNRTPRQGLVLVGGDSVTAQIDCTN